MKYILFFILIVVSTIFFCFFSKKRETLSVLRLHMKAQPKTLDPRKLTDVFSSHMIFLL